MKNIAIFASGNGSNAENIINFFEKNEEIKVKLIVCNKADAYVLTRAKNHGIESILVERKQFISGNYVVNILKSRQIDVVVLAGFLLLVPHSVIEAYSGRIINIHPALLPKYGGKGMYGMNVHRAVIANSEQESGITIHKVNDEYDKGEIIFNAKCSIDENDTPETVAEKVHSLEYQHFPKVIEGFIKSEFH